MSDKSVKRMPLPKDKRRSVVDKNITFENDGWYESIKRPFLSRIYRYVTDNRKKLIIMGIVGGIGFGIVAYFFLWPILTPVLAITLIVSSAFLVGNITSVLTGVLHYLFDKKARSYTNQPIRIPININSKRRSQQITSSDGIFEKSLHQNTVNSPEKDNLIQFMMLLGYNVPPSVLALESETGLIRLLRSYLQVNPEFNAFELIKKCLDKNGLTFSVNFKSLTKTFEQHPLFVTEGKRNIVTEFENLLHPVKIQCFLQLTNNGKINFEKIENPQVIDFTSTEKIFSSISPEEVVSQYFHLLKKNQKVADQLLEMHRQLTFPQKIMYEAERKRVRNVLSHFIKKLSVEEFNDTALDDRQLLTKFSETLDRSDENEIAAIYSKLKYTAPQNSYNINFFMQYIGHTEKFSNSELHRKINLYEKESSFIKENQKFFVCAKLFLRMLSLTETYEEKNVNDWQESFYQKLEKIPVAKVLTILSQLRFNSYLQLNLGEFRDLLKDYYQKKDPALLAEFNQGLENFNQPQYIKEHIQPLLVLLKNFLSFSNVPINTVVPAKEMLPLFFNALHRMSADEVITNFKNVCSSINNSQQINFLYQLIYNYFEFNRPKDFDHSRADFNFSEWLNDHLNKLQATCSSLDLDKKNLTAETSQQLVM